MMNENQLDALEPPPRDSRMRRRAFAVIAAMVASNVAFVLLYLRSRAGLSTGADAFVLGAILLGGLALLVFGVEPFRRQELRENLGTKAPRFTWRVLLVIAGTLALTIVAWHLIGTPWRAALARGAGVVGYLLVFVSLARLQRLGITPYLRPAWYGFLLAGATGGMVWAQAAGEAPADGIINGTVFCAMHYAYVRWAMRGTAVRAARRTS